MQTLNKKLDDFFKGGEICTIILHGHELTPHGSVILKIIEDMGRGESFQQIRSKLKLMLKAYKLDSKLDCTAQLDECFNLAIEALRYDRYKTYTCEHPEAPDFYIRFRRFVPMIAKEFFNHKHINLNTLHPIWSKPGSYENFLCLMTRLDLQMDIDSRYHYNPTHDTEISIILNNFKIISDVLHKKAKSKRQTLSLRFPHPIKVNDSYDRDIATGGASPIYRTFHREEDVNDMVELFNFYALKTRLPSLPSIKNQQ